MRVVLVDDEAMSLKVLEMTLQKIEGIEVVGKFTDPQEALNRIQNLETDVVFLDMEMGSINGLEIAEQMLLRKYDIGIVFVTAYSEYALEAFEVSAIDYLLKPVSVERLKKTIFNLKKRIITHKNEEITIQNQKTEEQFYIYSFGRFRLLDADKNDIKWRTKKVKELFAYLWHFRERPCPRMRIIEDLWPDIPLDKAVALLHTTIYSLRKTIKQMGRENPIILKNEKYFLNILIKSDFEDFNIMLKSNLITHSYIKEILKSYQGDYFEEENYEWLFYEQQKIKENLMVYLKKYVLTFINSNDIQKTSTLLENCLEKMLQIDPYNEQYANLMIKYYIEINNKGKLIQFYKGFKNRIEKELGLRLSEETIKLYQQYIF
jgi:two-component SAPR family response regulator